ncbi:MAG: GGDEF domain-containing protein [Rhodospirillum sp.]|nr:GGDEF domain-containing protein [Rhodospirillum sp.]MCF8492148.1 GGDEF domain-containing protein [Rhodospirillum sp.]MCF8502595.1 GGDEF domain-containing protein [Rhodospirillum sp.]
MAAQDAIPFPVYVVEATSLTLLAVNTAMRKLSGAVAGEPCYSRIYGQDQRCIHCPLEQMLEKRKNGRSRIVFEHFNEANDRWYQMEETLIPWHDGQIAKYSIAVDITALKEAQNALVEAHAELTLKSRQLERLVVTDQLTGLGNRRFLDQSFRSEVERAHRAGSTLSVMIGDVDGFKTINDSYGHPVGDAVLTLMAQSLKDNVRQLDIVGRWGGEEFAVICPQTDLAGAVTLAEKLRDIIARQNHPHVGRKTMSFGVATYRLGEPVTDLIRRADQALYRAKDKGRNRVEADLSE